MVITWVLLTLEVHVGVFGDDELENSFTIGDTG
jgi:hypothetical protein